MKHAEGGEVVIKYRRIWVVSILLPCNLKLKHHGFMAVERGTFYRFDEGESNFVNILLSYGSFIDAFICNFTLLTSSSSLGRPYTQPD